MKDRLSSVSLLWLVISGGQSGLGFQKKFLESYVNLQGDCQLTVSARTSSEKPNALMRGSSKNLGNSNSPNVEAVTPTSGAATDSSDI